MHPPGALASAAGLVDHLAGALTGRAGALDGEEALLGPHPAAAAAALAGDRLGAALGAAAAAVVAGHRGRHADLRALAVVGVLQGDFHVVAQVGPARRRVAAAPAHEVAEHLVEDVRETAGGEAAEAGPARTATAVGESVMAEAVVGRALLIVLEDFIGLVDFLEARLGLGIARVAVRMILHGQLAIGRLQRAGIGVAADAQSFVIVLHGFARCPHSPDRSMGKVCGSVARQESTRPDSDRGALPTPRLCPARFVMTGARYAWLPFLSSSTSSKSASTTVSSAAALSLSPPAASPPAAPSPSPAPPCS